MKLLILIIKTSLGNFTSSHFYLPSTS